MSTLRLQMEKRFELALERLRYSGDALALAYGLCQPDS